ncbi:MAG: hypothetical protein HZA31_11790 [Opitutae bacterium]|nr:hypothetical protein [Opitutae bacterium]
MAPASRASTERLPVFFPPTPPPLGTPVPPQQPSNLRLVAPTELALYVNEPFYAPLSTRLVGRNLEDRLRQRLDGYRASKSSLQAELRAKIESLKSADAATRQRELEAFALLQTPHLVELEKSADQFRTDLLRNGLVGLLWGKGDWNETREWRLGKAPLDKARELTLAAEFQVMRAAVFYQDGLLPAQRRLLREVAMDLQVEAFRPKNSAATADDEKLIFFAPETARVRLPDDPSPELATKIDTYQKEKAELKSELREAIYQQDRASSSQRTQALRQLAESQAPRIAALEVLADDIRRILAQQEKRPGPPTPPTIPPDLAKRITTYQKEKQKLQKLLLDNMMEIRKKLAPAKVRFVKADESKSDLHPMRLEISPALPSEEKQKQVKEVLAAFNRENSARFTALGAEKEAIRNELSRFVSTGTEAAGSKSVDTLLKEFDDAVQKQEAWQLYGEYEMAVFQPGLSPEQRRLLFDAALEKLALPLPGGERQP